MSGKPPFSLEQVSKTLGLSEAVIRRISGHLHLPGLYYPGDAGKPKLMVYSELEVQILQRVQHLLVEGYTMEESEAAVKDLVLLAHHQAHQVTSGNPELMDYADDTLKAQLAETSLAQYRKGQAPKQPVFEALIHRITPEKPPIRTLSSSATSPFGGKPLPSGWSSPQNSWMSPVFSDIESPVNKTP